MNKNILNVINDLKNIKLINLGYKHKLITPFDDDIIIKLRDKYYGGIPGSILIGYKPYTSGKCYERSLLLSSIFDDCELVIADSTNLKLIAGRQMAMHAWVEAGGYVYDTTMGAKVKRELYYLIHRPYNIKRIQKHELLSDNTYCDITDEPNNLDSASAIVMTIDSTSIFDKTGFLKRELEIYKDKINYEQLVIDNNEMFNLLLKDEKTLAKAFKCK